MPGVIDIDINADWIDQPDARAGAGALSAFGQVGTVNDVADVVQLLASDAAPWITGQIIDVTGGSRL
jgi:3-oxoacyl-[acyl-carrier protein] reductase